MEAPRDLTLLGALPLRQLYVLYKILRSLQTYVQKEAVLAGCHMMNKIQNDRF